MKPILFTLTFLALTFNVKGQQDSTTLWFSTQIGNIYTLDVSTCDSQFICHCSKGFMDIAHTPDGTLYGITLDSLYQIYPDGALRGIGMIPQAKALVGLNDSTLLMDSAQYLLSVKTADASRNSIGYTGTFLHGDLTWMGNNLYFTGTKYINGHAYQYLGKLYFNETYDHIESQDSIALNPDSSYFAPALTTIYLKRQNGYALIGFTAAGSFKIDTSTALFSPICELGFENPPQFAYGASSMIFPPGTSLTSIGEYNLPGQEFHIYPNPVIDLLHIDIPSTKLNEDFTLFLYDYTGKLLMESRLKEETINVSEYPPGIYFIKFLSNKNTIYIQKLIRS